jgi:chromosome segregation protein
LLIKEVILENFMSYEYARIPIKSGLNLICGPNGSGKSSILLGISVALGQTYTERSRKLSDLIRWGDDSSRVTVVFDNKPKQKRRPVQRYNADFLRLSRYIKGDGTYWFEANFQTITKSEVKDILTTLGINPDNILIIMHQHTMEEFGIINLKQKLLMLEEAMGMGEYRKNILEAQEKLSQMISEEESIKNLLENAEQTLAYWKGEHEKYQRRKELNKQRDFLNREHFWSQLKKQEEIVDTWKNKISKKEKHLSLLLKNIEKNKEEINTISKKLNILFQNSRKSFYAILEYEKEKTECEVTKSICEGMITKLKFLNNIHHQIDLHESIKNIKNYMAELSSQIDYSSRRLKSVEEKISVTQLKITNFDEEIDKNSKKLLSKRVRDGIFSFQKKIEENELNILKNEHRLVQRDLFQLNPKLDQVGTRIDTQRNLQEISEDIKIIKIKLTLLGEISDDTEKMYLTCLNLFNELKQKALATSKNRKMALIAVEKRRQIWKRLLNSRLKEINQFFKKFLSNMDATGNIRLINSEDIETAGLELVVGFKGAEPAILDAYTQSGGERSAATMAFLLALQQFVKSPFRAVDEFDVHMDPRNREIFSTLLFKEISRNKDFQYLAITPGQITSVDENVHVITVQNVKGKSEVKVVA